MKWPIARSAERPSDAATPPAPEAAPPVRRPGTFAALSAPTYRRYWVGLILYVLGHRAEYVTYAWMVWELTKDPLYLGYLGLAQGTPFVLLQLGGGVLADRTNRLRLLRGTTICTGTVLTAAFVLTFTGLARVEHLLFLGALASTIRSFDDPTRQALLPQLIDRQRLRNAIALGSIPWQAGRVLGPSITGILVAAFGGPIGFAFAAGSTYAALGLYSRIRIDPGTRAGSRSVARELTGGLAFIGSNYLFRSLIGLALFNSLFGMWYITLLPIYADRYFGAGSEGYGLLQAAQGIGSIVATLAFATLAHRLRRRGLGLLLSASCFGLLLIALSRSPTLTLAMPVLLLIGLSNTLCMTQINTLLQERVPDGLRGRVLSAFSLCYNLVSFGGVLGGGLAAAVDARFAVLVGGALVASMALLLLASSSRLRAVP
jgi:MFS family permease